MLIGESEGLVVPARKKYLRPARVHELYGRDSGMRRSFNSSSQSAMNRLFQMTPGEYSAG